MIVASTANNIEVFRFGQILAIIILFFVYFGLVLPVICKAQTPANPRSSTTAPANTSKDGNLNNKVVDFDLRHFDDNAMKEMGKDPLYNYAKTSQDEGWFKQMLNKIWQFILNKFENLFGKLDGVTSYHIELLFKIVVYILFAASLIILIMRLLKADLRWLLFKRLNQTEIIANDLGIDQIHKLDLETLLREAIAQKNLNRAIRILYLKSLKYLADTEQVVWYAHKTNQDYLCELQKHPAKPQMTELTYWFDYACYGNFPIKQVQFDAAQKNYQAIEDIVQKLPLKKYPVNNN